MRRSRHYQSCSATGEEEEEEEEEEEVQLILYNRLIILNLNNKWRKVKNLPRPSSKISDCLQLCYSPPRAEVKFDHVMIVTCLDI